jgi:hypothetical protein
MAVMDLRRAQALAEELIKTGQNKGLSREALVQQIVAESGGAGAPGTAIGVVAPQPRKVTPATPAPMQQGVPLVAPKPVAEAPVEVAAEPAPARPTPQSSYRRALGSTQQQIAEVQTALDAMPANKDNILDRTRLQTRLQMLTDRAGMLEGEALATENAQIPEEVRAALENREARLARRAELLEEARARSPFEALIAGGAALTQGRRGERFTEALARGLQAGVQQYGRSRQELEEGVEGVGEARDEIVLKRYEALKQAQNEARNIIRSGREYDEKTLAIANATEGLIQKTALGESALDTAVAQAETAKVNAKYAEPKAIADLAYTQSATEENRRGPGGGGKEPAGLNDYRDQMSKALKDYSDLQAEYEAARANPDALPADVAKLRSQVVAAGQRYNAYGQALRNRYNVNPDILIPEKGLFAPKTGAKASATTGGKGWSAIKF